MFLYKTIADESHPTFQGQNLDQGLVRCLVMAFKLYGQPKLEYGCHSKYMLKSNNVTYF